MGIEERNDMIEILHDIFIGTMYLFGAAFFAFFVLVLVICIVKVWQGRK